MANPGNYDRIVPLTPAQHAAEATRLLAVWEGDRQEHGPVSPDSLLLASIAHSLAVQATLACRPPAAGQDHASTARAGRRH